MAHRPIPAVSDEGQGHPQTREVALSEPAAPRSHGSERQSSTTPKSDGSALFGAAGCPLRKTGKSLSGGTWICVHRLRQLTGLMGQTMLGVPTPPITRYRQSRGSGRSCSSRAPGGAGGPGRTRRSGRSGNCRGRASAQLPGGGVRADHAGLIERRRKAGDGYRVVVIDTEVVGGDCRVGYCDPSAGTCCPLGSSRWCGRTIRVARQEPGAQRSTPFRSLMRTFPIARRVRVKASLPSACPVD